MVHIIKNTCNYEVLLLRSALRGTRAPGPRFMSIWSWPNVLDFLLVLLAVFEVWVSPGASALVQKCIIDTL